MGKNNIEKRHFKFTYNSPITGHPIYILLDIVFEENHYARLVEKEIRNNLLLTDANCLKVCMPSINSILGDKLTTFAPHTVGIPLKAGKDMEVMKQLYDIYTLIEACDNFEEIYQSYMAVVASEISYRGLDLTPQDCLIDTLISAANIANKGKIDRVDYGFYLEGIRKVQGHIYAENFTLEVAAELAPKIMYVVASLMQHKEFAFNVKDANSLLNEQFINERFRGLKYLKKLNATAYVYAIMADRLLAEMQLQ